MSKYRINRQPSLLGFSFSFLFLFLLLVLNSCSMFNGTPAEKFLGAPTNLINFSHDLTDELVGSTMPPLMMNRADMPVLVTTFVDNNNLQQTGQFGRILQEQIMSRLVQLGYTVREHRLADRVEIKQRKGETILSRDLSRLSSEMKAQAIVVGTLSRQARHLYVSSRIIDPSSGNILASIDKRLYLDDSLLEFFGLRTLSTIDTPIEEPSAPLLNSVL